MALYGNQIGHNPYSLTALRDFYQKFRQEQRGQGEMLVRMETIIVERRYQTKVTLESGKQNNYW